MSSHDSAPSTTSLITVLAVALVHRERPDWLTVRVGDAARAAGVEPERVSRLATRVTKPLHALVEKLTQRGRPAREAPRDALRAELVRVRALLAVASALLALVTIRKSAARDLVVGAWHRLTKELPSLSKTDFCKALALSERTFRHWLRVPRASAPPTTPPAPPATKAPRKRALRRPRFQFDVFLPDTQFGADTTALSAFGVPLKLVGVQDIGGRDERLFHAVVIDTTESAKHVVDAFRGVLLDCPGAQAITDQGTPYMAAETRAALRTFEAEHAPQKEGDPTGKSTVEKGFDSLKRILEPLLSLSNTLATLVPALHSAELAIPFARLATGTVLRAYQAGARAARRAVDARGAADEDDLVRAAARAREAARADDRSARLLLAQLHDLFRFPDSATDFVNRFRRYPLDVLRSAETALRKRLLLHGADEVRSLDRYFAALVRSSFAEHRALRASREASRRVHRRLRDDNDQTDATRQHHLADPVQWLRDALDLLAMQWLPHSRTLLFDGEGLGLAWLRSALQRLRTLHLEIPLADLVHGLLDDFGRARNDDVMTHTIARLVLRELAALPPQQHSTLADQYEGAIPRPIGRSARSAAPSPLPI